MEEYTVFESDGIVTLVVSVLEGNIRTPITVAMAAVNGSALGKSTALVGVHNARLDVMNLV